VNARAGDAGAAAEDLGAKAANAGADAGVAGDPVEGRHEHAGFLAGGDVFKHKLPVRGNGLFFGAGEGGDGFAGAVQLQFVGLVEVPLLDGDAPVFQFGKVGAVGGDLPGELGLGEAEAEPDVLQFFAIKGI